MFRAQFHGKMPAGEGQLNRLFWPPGPTQHNSVSPSKNHQYKWSGPVMVQILKKLTIYRQHSSRVQTIRVTTLQSISFAFIDHHRFKGANIVVVVLTVTVLFIPKAWNQCPNLKLFVRKQGLIKSLKITSNFQSTKTKKK